MKNSGFMKKIFSFSLFLAFSGGAFAAEPTALFLLDAQPNVRL
jgi:hypothetical protein